MTYDLRTFRGDLFGGITATVVVFPAALAFGMASGLGAPAGIYGSIAVGFFAAVFGGTRTQISGPTGPMVVVTAVIVASHASTLSEALTIVVMGLSGPVLEIFRALDLLRNVSAERNVETLEEAREIARALLNVGMND